MKPLVKNTSCATSLLVMAVMIAIQSHAAARPQLVPIASGRAQGNDTTTVFGVSSTRTLQLDNSMTARLALTYDFANRYQQAGELDLAIASLREILRVAPDYRDAKFKLAELQKSHDRQRQQGRLEAPYQAARQAYEDKDWAGAIVALEFVYHQNPAYRDVRQLLFRSYLMNSRLSRSRFIRSNYRAAVRAMKQNDLLTALQALERVFAFDPNYRDVANLIPEIEAALAAQAVHGSDSFVHGPLGTSPDSLYRCALTAMEWEDWQLANTLLHEVKVVDPHYPGIEEEIKYVQGQFGNQARLAKRVVAPEAAWQLPGGPLGTLVAASVLLGLTAVFAIPRVRIHLLLGLGNWNGAVRTLERQLEANPNHFKALEFLAKLYAQRDRNDRKAVVIYQRVLDLGLATPLRDKMNSIVVDYYLHQKKIDSKAIVLFERELKRR